MDEDEEETAGIESVDDTTMRGGTTSTSDVKLDDRGGAGMPKPRKKKNKGKGGGKTRSRSPKAGSRITKPAQ
jgi:hypothetical protein